MWSGWGFIFSYKDESHNPGLSQSACHLSLGRKGGAYDPNCTNQNQPQDLYTLLGKALAFLCWTWTEMGRDRLLLPPDTRKCEPGTAQGWGEQLGVWGLDPTMPEADFSAMYICQFLFMCWLRTVWVALPSLVFHKMNDPHSNQSHCATNLYQCFILSAVC